MAFNVAKCNVLDLGRHNPSHDYTMGGIPIPTLVVEKDLGILVTNTLSLSKQCAKAARKARDVLYNISRSQAQGHYRDHHIFVCLYKQYVTCLLEYASPAWSPSQISDIECKVQSTMVSLIPSLSLEPPKLGKLVELNLNTREDRRGRQDLILAYRIISGMDKVDPHSLFKFHGEQARPTRMSIVHGT